MFADFPCPPFQNISCPCPCPRIGLSGCVCPPNSGLIVNNSRVKGSVGRSKGLGLFMQCWVKGRTDRKIISTGTFDVIFRRNFFEPKNFKIFLF